MNALSIFQSIVAIFLIVSGIYIIRFKKTDQNKNHLIVGCILIILGLYVMIWYTRVYTVIIQ